MALVTRAQSLISGLQFGYGAQWGAHILSPQTQESQWVHGDGQKEALPGTLYSNEEGCVDGSWGPHRDQRSVFEEGAFSPMDFLSQQSSGSSLYSGPGHSPHPLVSVPLL